MAAQLPMNETTAEQPTGETVSAEKLLTNISRFLSVIGEPGTCRGCGAKIWWIQNPKTGKRLPVTGEALNHFADCPNANSFKKQ